MSLRRTLARAAVAATCSLSFVSAAFGATPSDYGRTPQQLVAAALRTELDGPSTQREALLRQAIAVDPNFAPARWQLGFVRWEDQWRTLDEVRSLAGDDAQLAEYRRRRDALIDTSDNQRALARWCERNKLRDEERMHWSKVLAYEPNDAEALAALGVQWVDGRMLTRRQVIEEKQLAAARQQALYQWRTKLRKWRKAITEGNAQERADAVAALSRVSDPAAMGALELVFASRGEDERSARLNQLLLDTLSRIPQKEATAALLRYAVFSESEKLAMAAADALKQRPMHTYVPQLVATMPSPLKSQFHVTVQPDGTVIHQHELRMERPEGTYVMSYESVVHPTDPTIIAQVTPRAVLREQAKAAAIESAAAVQKQSQEALAGRIRRVLKQTTGFDDVEDPRLWIVQYADYYGWSAREKSYKEFHQHTAEYEAYSPAPPVPAVAGECFVAGTPVMTVLGPRPIESIKPGDRVLSQNVDTGELAYKTVQDRTLRIGENLIKIRAGDESLVATPGHAFFVAGGGWNVAKFLKVGDRLCGLGPAALVEGLEEQPRSEVYNLVVSDFHTFFVGNSKLLVHDDAALEDTTARVPGLLAGVEP